MAPARILTTLGITEVITVSCDATVEQALHILDDRGLRSAPVVDENNVFHGMFSNNEIIKTLVPSYMTDGMANLSFAAGASPLLAKRLRKLFPSRVGDHVSADDCVKVTDPTRTWEALRMLSKYGSPLPVVDRHTGQLLGLLTEQAAVQALLTMEAEESDDTEQDAG
ncbi:MAG: CBS domain-containing protein [Pseudomonadota bacterium]